jgi:KaiC/GvpD/RAD55 family RecA-like ATPase
MAGRLKTGIEILDRRLDGGVPSGSVVAITGPPDSQTELLLYELTATRGSLYLTTERTERAVNETLATLEGTRASVGEPTVRHIPREERLEQANRLFRALPEGANLIIDTADPLERTETDQYRSFLNDLRDHMVDIDSVAFVHCLTGPESRVPRNRNTTLHMADVIFNLRKQIRGTDVEIQLTVPKYRGGSALMNTIKLEITDSVAIDTSRDIA